MKEPGPARCASCGHQPHDWSSLPPRAYAYLLGAYLGDGTISAARKGVWRLRIVQDIRYPGIVRELADAAYVWQEPGMFIRGLIHSDGCRVSNKVWHGKYAYPRYFFSNESTDIQQLFRDACNLIGIEHRNNRRNSISVARRASVAKLDEIVGPKT